MENYYTTYYSGRLINEVDSTNLANALAALPAGSLNKAKILLVNDPTYGGGGSTLVAAGYCSRLPNGACNTSSMEALKHEFAHQFARLADEYAGGGTPFPGPANIAYSPTPTAAPWSLWITPATKEQASSLQAGGCSTFLVDDEIPGLYVPGYAAGTDRPTNNSKMNQLLHCDGTPVPYEQINTEQIILSMYGAMTFPDGQTPPATSPTTTVFQGDSYNFEPIVPANNNPPPQFFYTWTVDPNNGSGGTPVCGGSQAGPQQCTVATANLSLGTHTVQVAIQDASTMLKKVLPASPAGNVQWQLNVTACGNHDVTGPSYQGWPTYTYPAAELSGVSAYVVQECTYTLQDVTTLDCHNNVKGIQTRDTGAPRSCADCPHASPVPGSFDTPTTDPSCRNHDGSFGNRVCTTKTDDYTFTCKDETFDEPVYWDYTCTCYST